MASTQPGAWPGDDSRPPAKASGKNSTWATAIAAFDGREYPMVRPISVNGTAISTTVPAARASRAGSTVASVQTAAITTTGVSDTNVSSSPHRIRPANRGAGPAGSVRVNGSQGCARSSAMPIPYWNRFVVMTAKVTMDAVANVAPTG